MDLFWTLKQPSAINFLTTTCNVCPVAIPEIIAQTQATHSFPLTRVSLSYLDLVPAHFLTLRHLLLELLVVALAD